MMGSTFLAAGRHLSVQHTGTDIVDSSLSSVRAGGATGRQSFCGWGKEFLSTVSPFSTASNQTVIHSRRIF
jgi:hypothetical protein